MINHAVVLAGGFGTRLGNILKDIPKPLAPINEQPFLNYLFRFLKHYGIQEITVSVGHLSDKISNYYQSSFEEIKINYSIETTPLGTGGGTRLAINKISDENILILNGDSFFDLDLTKFIQLHFKHNTSVSIALRKIENTSRYGTIEINSNNEIIKFKEKNGLELPGLINTGIYILNRETFLNNTPTKTFSIEKDFFESHLQKIKMLGYVFEGDFIDIGTPEDYKRANDEFKRFKYK